MGPSHVQIPYHSLILVYPLALLGSGARNLSRVNKKENEQRTRLSFIPLSPREVKKGKEKVGKKIQVDYEDKKRKKNTHTHQNQSTEGSLI